MKSSIVAFCLPQATSFSSFSWVFANFSFHSPCFGYWVEELFYFMDLKHAFPSLLALTPTAFVYHIVLCWYGLDLQMTSAFFILVYVSSIAENVWPLSHVVPLRCCFQLFVRVYTPHVSYLVAVALLRPFGRAASSLLCFCSNTGLTRVANKRRPSRSAGGFRLAAFTENVKNDSALSPLNRGNFLCFPWGCASTDVVESFQN